MGNYSGAVSQGIGVATGLQHSFGWTSVIAAGTGNGVFGMVDGSQLLPNGPRFSSAWDVNQAVSGLASGFADNLTAALPDVIGQTIGNLVAGGIESQPTGGGKSLFGGIGDGISSLVHGVEHIGLEILNEVEQVGGSVLHGVEDIGTGVVSGVEELINPTTDADVGGPHGRWPTIQPKDPRIGTTFGDGRGTISYNGRSSDGLTTDQLVTQKLVTRTQRILLEDTGI